MVKKVMLSKKFLIQIILILITFIIPSCLTVKYKYKCIDNSCFKIVLNKSIINNYNKLFVAIMPFNFEINNNRLRYFDIVFNKKEKFFKKNYKNIKIMDYIENFYNSINDFNIWLIIFIKDLNSYHYYNFYTKNNKIIVCEYINNINDLDYLKYIFDEYKYIINTYEFNITDLSAKNNINLVYETELVNHILNDRLNNNTDKKIIFRNNKFFVIVDENYNNNPAFSLFWTNSYNLLNSANFETKNCKVFYSGSANNTNYICIDKNYIYNVSINYVSHINVPMYELDIYKNNNKNIDDFEEYNFYDILQNSEIVLFSQELKLIN